MGKGADQRRREARSSPWWGVAGLVGMVGSITLQLLQAAGQKLHGPVLDTVGILLPVAALVFWVHLWFEQRRRRARAREMRP